ncbi:MAG: lantibiotic dehydratase, partial [Ectothiorhodospiraceae bacterium]
MNRQAKGQPPSDGLVDSGFFVLRTPLLPFAELEAWSGELRYPQSRAREGADLESDIESDRQMLRRRLRPLLDSAPVRQAVYIASPSLAESLSAWLESPDAGRGGKAESSLVSYLMRMAGRATPFGLFAGCSIGRIGARSQLALAPRSAY